MPKYKTVKSELGIITKQSLTPPPTLLHFEAMITYYGNPDDGYQYKGKDEVVVVYVDDDAEPDDLKAQGLTHLKPGALYLADVLPWPDIWHQRKGWATKLAKKMQKAWDKDPTSNNLPLFLQEKRKSWRVLLTSA